MVHSREKSRSYPDFRQRDIDPTSERRVKESVVNLIHHCDQAFHHKLNKSIASMKEYYKKNMTDITPRTST